MMPRSKSRKDKEAAQPLPWQGSPLSKAEPVTGAGQNRSPSTEGMHRSSPAGPRPHVTAEHTGSSTGAHSTDSGGAGESELASPRPWNLAMGEAQPSTRVVQYAQFTSLKYLGAGEFATVHADVLDGVPVALKMLKQSKRDEVRPPKPWPTVHRLQGPAASSLLHTPGPAGMPRTKACPHSAWPDKPDLHHPHATCTCTCHMPGPCGQRS